MSASDLPPLLVIDHQADDRELLRLVLRGAWGEASLEEAPNAAALARQMTVGTFGLVVTETNLPWIKGEDVVRLVRDLRPGVPVIVLTARPLPEVATELIHLAPDAVVPKTSAGWTDLPRVIRRLLDDVRRRARVGEGAATLPAGAASDAEEMAYVVSHDLRKPLTQVVRTLDLLASDGKDGKAKETKDGDLLSLARRGAHRLETLVDGVEAYARITTEPVREKVELEALLGRVLQRLADERAAGKAEVTHDPLPAVVGSAPQLEQLFANLLGNAIKFRGDRAARVHVGAERRDGAWHVTVKDEGIGIDPRDAERIFGLFQRLHTEDEYPGSGIGLALCRRIVERHGGRIWVDSRPGAGATFHVTLPQAGEPES